MSGLDIVRQLDVNLGAGFTRPQINSQKHENMDCPPELSIQFTIGDRGRPPPAPHATVVTPEKFE